MMSRLLTYGSTFVLDCAPGTVWRVDDARMLDYAGIPTETRARLRPASIGGEKVEFHTPIRIGRAARNGLSIAVSTDRHASAAGGEVLSFWATAQDGLTDAQRAQVHAELAGMTFDLPLHTAEQIRAQMMRVASYAGERAAREVWGNLPDRFNSSGSGDTLRGRGLISAVMAEDPAHWQEFIRLASEAFARRAATDIASY